MDAEIPSTDGAVQSVYAEVIGTTQRQREGRKNFVGD